MRTRRAAVVATAALAALTLTACEPIDTTGQSTNTKTAKTRSSKSSSAKSTQRVEYETTTGKAPSRRSVVVRSGSVAKVTSTGTGSVSCRIVVNGKTVVRKSGSGSVTCSTRINR